MTATASEIVIRPCSGYAEIDACVDLQEAVWGYEDRDIIPRRLFIVAQRIGGQVFGAFPSAGAGADQMVGFAMALPAWASHPQGAAPLYLHSHMLAVSSNWRNAGIGRSLKLAQREEALARGIRKMEWTFDPLEGKNAYLNIQRLGVIVRSYTPDFYGPTSSPLQAGLQTDRMHAEWLLDSDRVKRVVDGQPFKQAAVIAQCIELPAALPVWKQTSADRGRAANLQARNREAFLKAFQQGQVVVGFHRDAAGNGFYDLADSAAVLA